MTITEARRLQVRHFGAATLPTICSDTHGALCGSSDPWTELRYAQAREVLHARLATWQPGREKDERFDSAVKALCEATLAELENHR